MKGIDEIDAFIEKALTKVDHGKIVVEIKVVNGVPVAINGMTHETLKRTKGIRNAERIE